MRQAQPSVSPMSNEARNSYVIGQITSALIGLLRTKTIEEVSISELCAAAGVGRASFYRNFDSKEAVLQRQDEALVRRWQKDYDAAKARDEAAGREPENLMVSLLMHYKAHREFYAAVYRNDRAILRDTILRICGPQEDDQNIWAYTKAFIAYGIYGTVCTWMDRGMTESAEELAALMRLNQEKAQN